MLFILATETRVARQSIDDANLRAGIELSFGASSVPPFATLISTIHESQQQIESGKSRINTLA
jgi:hypothetical protein